jgi:membrane associated rhomboid family serine protease
VATLSHYVTNSGSYVPTVGASGAISGVLGAYLLLFPHARIDTLVTAWIITFITVPAGFFLLIWIGLQLLSGLPSLGGSEVMSGVAYFAHIGGFVAGLIFVKLFDQGEARRQSRREDNIMYWSDRR